MDVFITNLTPATPTYHRIPDWHIGEGRRGEEVACNAVVYAGTDRVIGNNGGIPLPEQVVSPCGIVVYRRSKVIPRSDPFGGTETLNKARMRLQGQQIPLRHAKKFGRPCKTCFPKEDA